MRGLKRKEIIFKLQVNSAVNEDDRFEYVFGKILVGQEGKIGHVWRGELRLERYGAR